LAKVIEFEELNFELHKEFLTSSKFKSNKKPPQMRGSLKEVMGSGIMRK